MASTSTDGLLRRTWWWGLLVGLALPLTLIPANVYLIRWFGHTEIIANTAVLLAAALAIAGALLMFRRWWGLLVALAYVPLLLFYFWLLQLVIGCAVIGRYACL